MAHVRTILIAAPELIPALRERVGGDEEVLTFSDAEPMRALEVIVRQRPPLIVLERLFAATPRGAALITRLKADPALDHSQIVIMAHDSDYRRVSPRRKRAASGAVRAASGAVRAASGAVRAASGTARAASGAVRAAKARLDTGTRRAPRWKMRVGVTVAVDDEVAGLVDLSVLGAQVLATEVLKPGQRVEVRFEPGRTGLVVPAEVIWVKVELAGRRPRYRAGVEFRRAAAQALTAFAEAHKA